MKTLFLTSAGLKAKAIQRELLKILPKPASKMKLAHVITASKAEENTGYVDRDRKEMKNMGFKVVDIDIEDKTEDELRKLLEYVDIIYVQGGNGFYLLKHVRVSGFENVVRELLERGVIYIGVSAGTYIACPTIEMHSWKGKERNRFGVIDLAAMNLVPFLVSVHYNREKYKKGVKEGAARSRYPVKILTDDQALLVTNGEVQLVGEGEEVVI